jgi:hypothetical protein
MRTFTAIHCYGRVSDPSQVEGTGLERQLGNMETFCRKENIAAPLTRLITDDGRSGFHGHHRSIGHLGVFEAEVARGEWRGSLFLCENLDRFSREGHDAGTDLLRKFINGGVTVWTLDGDRFEADQRLDMMQAITAILKFELAHQESVKKFERNLANWIIRREHCRVTGEAISKVCPPWLEIDPATKRYRTIPHLAAIVHDIFVMTDELSMGSYTVAKTLNERGVQTFPQRYRNRVPKGWDHTYIDLLLKNRAVIGEHQPMHRVKGKRVPNGEPWVGHYPQIVPHDLFNRVRGMAAARKSTGTGQRRHKKVHNLFAPLTRCHECGVAMHYNRECQRFDRPMGSLLCPTNKRGGHCSNDARWHYLAFEDGVLDATLHLVMDERAFANRGELSRLDSTIAERERDLELAKAKAARLWDAFASTGSENAQAAAMASDAECKRLADNLAALVQQKAEASGRVDSAAHMKRIADIRSALYHPDADERLKVRLKVSQHIHRLFESIEMGRERARVMLVAGAGFIDFDRDGKMITGFDLVKRTDRQFADYVRRRDEAIEAGTHFMQGRSAA